MIKINLLAERKAPKSGPSKTLAVEGLGESRNLLLAGVLLVAIVMAVGWWWMLSSKLEDLRADIDRARTELAQLEEVRKKGKMYEQQKALLERKIQLITNLKKKQSVPVHLLDQVSKNLPDFLWLDSLTAQNQQVNIAGKATTYNAVSTLYNSLSSSGYFSDVELDRASEVREGVAFTLMCKFAPPGAAGSKSQGQS